MAQVAGPAPAPQGPQAAAAALWKRQSTCVHVWDLFPVVSGSRFRLGSVCVLCVGLCLLNAAFRGGGKAGGSKKGFSMLEFIKCCFSELKRRGTTCNRGFYWLDWLKEDVLLFEECFNPFKFSVFVATDP